MPPIDCYHNHRPSEICLPRISFQTTIVTKAFCSDQTLSATGSSLGFEKATPMLDKRKSV